MGAPRYHVQNRIVRPPVSTTSGENNSPQTGEYYQPRPPRSPEQTHTKLIQFEEEESPGLEARGVGGGGVVKEMSEPAEFSLDLPSGGEVLRLGDRRPFQLNLLEVERLSEKQGLGIGPQKNKRRVHFEDELPQNSVSPTGTTSKVRKGKPILRMSPDSKARSGGQAGGKHEKRQKPNGPGDIFSLDGVLVQDSVSGTEPGREFVVGEAVEESAEEGETGSRSDRVSQPI